MDAAKSLRERNSAQTGVVQSAPSPRHYGDPLLVRVTAEETVGVRFLFNWIFRIEPPGFLSWARNFDVAEY